VDCAVVARRQQRRSGSARVRVAGMQQRQQHRRRATSGLVVEPPSAVVQIVYSVLDMRLSYRWIPQDSGIRQSDRVPRVLRIFAS
jgi:hypothetical protein